MIYHITGGRQNKGIWEQYPEVNNWTQKEVEKVPQRETSWYVPFTQYF